MPGNSAPSDLPGRPALRPLPARSVLVSLLLGVHPEGMSPGHLVAAAEHFGVPAATARVALTRAVAAGELRREAAAYHLGERLLARRRQELRAEPGAWDGRWRTAVVVSAGRPSAERAGLRARLAAARLAELREGVWLRPHNLPHELAPAPDSTLHTFLAVPEQDPTALAAQLWDLSGWADECDAALADMGRAREPVDRLAAAAHLVRHLTRDPLLPAELTPRHWPADQARAAVTAFEREVLAVSTQPSPAGAHRLRSRREPAC